MMNIEVVCLSPSLNKAVVTHAYWMPGNLLHVSTRPDVRICAGAHGESRAMTLHLEKEYSQWKQVNISECTCCVVYVWWWWSVKNFQL